MASHEVHHYVRYESAGSISYGRLEGETIHPVEGGLFGARSETGDTVALSEVKLLYPCEPTKVLCVGLNYRSHLGERPVPKNPEIFYKLLTSLQNPGDPIVIPPDSKDCHYEGEFVIVMGQDGRNLSEEDAEKAIFGYTCGNDVSERNWQNGTQGDPKDVQWWRAKASDTFGPFGPSIAVGLDYSKSRLTTRLNGEVKQTQLISDLIFGPAVIVSFISRYLTLRQGDIIFTGTPGSTSAMKDGDVAEVEITGIGTLTNPVVRG